MTNQAPCSPPRSAWSTTWIKQHLDRMDRGDHGREVGTMDADAARPTQKQRYPWEPLR
ncbi:hypothetical protein SAMN04490239_1626 [Rhodococcus koreensis]|jgi:hypothetical protein|uniref:Uncharacterized protein n=1 Tax=Rhodococcus koreensis TaxID=99653 RepID=A0A1H4M4F1_9NOCA|nr:hypothetical protein SAMN04490239_1626 [Rhodococcus koreensis]